MRRRDRKRQCAEGEGREMKRKPRPKMRRYGIFVDVDGKETCVATVDATSPPEAHRIYARQVEAERAAKKGKPDGLR
jgi:hypothetical protein